VHDLVHFAVESEARLRCSFYGLLASGVTYASLTDASAMTRYGGEVLDTERVVGAVQGALKGDVDAAQFLATFTGALESAGEKAPAWLTVDLIRAVQARMRHLLGAWRATKFGDALELRSGNRWARSSNSVFASSAGSSASLAR
jgi:hypothetical protein